MSDVELTEAVNEARLTHIRERLAAYQPAPVYDVTNRAVEDMLWLVGIVDDLAARLSQEREQVRAERDREWRGAVEAFVEQYREIAFLGYDPADPVVKYVSATKVADRLRALAQDGPRPAQEGE